MKYAIALLCALLTSSVYATDPLAELVWPETKWAFGEPDYIIQVPEQMARNKMGFWRT